MAHTSTQAIHLHMTRRFEASAERLYEAWVSPDQIKKWLFTQEATNKIARNELHVGGEWQITDHREGKDYTAMGEYLELDPPKRLVFTFKMPQFSDTMDTIIVEIEAQESGCDMNFTQEIVVPYEEDWQDEEIEQAKREYHTASEEGWKLMFDGLAQLLAMDDQK